ncbi:MAG: hypothetical protein HQL19_00500 [Candidatus Omnitrophica bacterium]|nr:hypothetical protein [Candidatus Omnitrophota bacterium]
MAGMDVKDLIRKLVALQKIDVELYEYKRELRETPILLDEIKAVFDAKKARFHTLEKKAQDLERARKAKELDLKSKEEDILKANNGLMLLKTNKEYQARLFEIENMKADKSKFEEEVLKFMDESEKNIQDIAKEKAIVDAEEQKYLAEKNKVDGVINGLKDKVAVVDVRRKEAMAGMDAHTLSVYEKVVENRDGSAVVPLVNNTCGGCFMLQPPQVLNKIRMYTEVVRCDMCTRFLYIEDEL